MMLEYRRAKRHAVNFSRVSRSEGGGQIRLLLLSLRLLRNGVRSALWGLTSGASGSFEPLALFHCRVYLALICGSLRTP